MNSKFLKGSLMADSQIALCREMLHFCQISLSRMRERITAFYEILKLFMVPQFNDWYPQSNQKYTYLEDLA